MEHRIGKEGGCIETRGVNDDGLTEGGTSPASRRRRGLFLRAASRSSHCIDARAARGVYVRERSLTSMAFFYLTSSHRSFYPAFLNSTSLGSQNSMSPLRSFTTPRKCIPATTSETASPPITRRCPRTPTTARSGTRSARCGDETASSRTDSRAGDAVLALGPSEPNRRSHGDCWR